MNRLNFRTVRFKLIFIFSLFTAIILLIISVFLWSGFKTGEIDKVIVKLNKLNFITKEVLIVERDFTIYETINLGFFKTGRSLYVDKYNAFLEELDANLVTLQPEFIYPQELDTKFKSIEELREEIKKVKVLFNEYVEKISQRGFKDYGLEGEMRKLVHDIEDNKRLDLAKVLMLRRHEKDYFLRKEDSYLVKLKEAVRVIQDDIRTKMTNPEERNRMIDLSENYFKTFLKIYELDKVLGLQGKDEGLRFGISIGLKAIEEDIQTLNQYMQEYTAIQKQQVTYTLTSVVFLLLLIGSVLVGMITNSLGKSIRKLSKSIHYVIKNNFDKSARISTINTKDEIESLSKDVALMLEKVQERTEEVLNQKEIINRSYHQIELLSEIGQKITNELDVIKIIDVFHTNITPLMNASVIAIGIFEEDKKLLRFYAESGTKKDFGFDKLEDTHLYSVKCFTSGKQIFVNDLSEEEKIAVVDKSMKSLIYEPLIVNNKTLGVITVQHVKPHIYKEFHADILRSIAVYTAIAIDNALVYQMLQLQSQELLEKTEELLTSEEELKQQAEELATQRDALQEQSAELTKKNEDTLSSINYAQRIQKAIMPTKSKIKEVIDDFFIFFKPRDIVSGDFYWFSKKENKIIVAVIDCTGHGVPGAFMSMIGNDLLNQVVHDKEIHQPDKILNEMHKGIRYALKQAEGDNRDGMDVSIVVIDRDKGIVEFAGAKGSVVFIQNGELYQIKGDKMPIGGEQREIQRVFTKHEIKLEEKSDNLFYLFSDGYQDQFGGKDGKKFMFARLRELLLGICHEPMQEQKEILTKTLKNWMDESRQRQIDDILFMGMKL